MTQSLSLDDLMDFTDAFLILRGMGGADEESVKQMRLSKILEFDDASGNAEWLIKNLNDTYIENLKSRLQTDIHKFSNIPDMSDSNFAGNSTGVAIKYKLLGMEQVRSHKEREFKKSLQRIDFRDVEIAFTPNIPANNQELAQIVRDLQGVVSQKRLLSLLPFVEDPVAELEELKHEQDISETMLRDEEGYPDEYEESGVLATESKAESKGLGATLPRDD